MLGVIPTATDKAKSRASLKFCFIMPSTITTKIQTIIMYFKSKWEILLIPLSKLVSFLQNFTFLPTFPK